jgi:serine/threonine-protein kinase RsbW
MTVLDMKADQRIDFKSTSENVSLVEKLVDDVCAKHEIHEDHYGNLLIALTEAVNNAIVHGNGNDPDKKVSVQYQSGIKSIDFKIKDEGPGFDFDNLPDPTDPKNIEKPNGRGVFLMKNLADEVNFHDDGRVVELKFEVLAN